MANTLQILFDICLLRKGPEDLPADKNVMWMLIYISFVVSIVLGMIIYDTQIAVLSSLAGLFFSFVFAKILLRKNPERFTQTFSAMLGTVTIINLISLPITYTLSNQQENQSIVSFLTLISFALLIWIVVVYGSIFSRAISSVFSFGIAISVGYVLLSIMILETLLSTKVVN